MSSRSLVYIAKKSKDFEQYFLRYVVGQLHVALACSYAYLSGSSYNSIQLSEAHRFWLEHLEASL